jgi:hypothetical protein
MATTVAIHGFHRHLDWRDYPKVSVSKDDNLAAWTHTDISINYEHVSTSDSWWVTSVSVTLTLNLTLSWVVSGQESKHLLKHEQVHYDLAAIAARELAGRLAKLKGDGSQKRDEAIAAVANEVAGDLSADGKVVARGLLQEVTDLYDTGPVCGTAHGDIKHHKHQQIRWEHRVAWVCKHPGGVLEQLMACPLERGGVQRRAHRSAN